MSQAKQDLRQQQYDARKRRRAPAPSEVAAPDTVIWGTALVETPPDLPAAAVEPPPPAAPPKKRKRTKKS